MQWRPNTHIHLGPYLASREQLVGRNAKDHTYESLHGSEADKRQEDERVDCEEQPCSLVETVEVELSDWLSNGFRFKVGAYA